MYKITYRILQYLVYYQLFANRDIQIYIVKLQISIFFSYILPICQFYDIIVWVIKMEKDLPKRKNNRLQNYDYSSCGAYFITICSKDRKNIFWRKQQPDFVGEDIILPPDSVRLSQYGKIADEFIREIPVHYSHIELLQYVIMPNHIHLILCIPDNNGRIISSPTFNRRSILTAVGQMKRQVSKKIGQKIWQRSFHDHIIRGKNDYEKISKYMYENPVKWQFDCFYTNE